MKLKSLINGLLTAAFLAFGISSVQAVDVDTDTPDILSSVSSGLVQTLSKAESAEARGEAWVCYTSSGLCGVRFSLSEPVTNSSFVVHAKRNLGSFWVSR